MNKNIYYIGFILILIGCTNNTNNEKWNELKKDRKFDKLLVFTSKNLHNSFCDSAITYLTDTSIQFTTHGIIIKDSIDFKTNQAKIYSDFEYGCLEPIPPFQKRVAFRIQIKNNDSLLVNNTLCKQEEVKTKMIDFVLNSNNVDSLPPKSIEKIEEWGNIEITNAVVEIYCNLYELGFNKNYIEKIAQLMNVAYNGYNDIRNIKSKEIFKKKFADLNSKEKELIRKIHPLRLYIKIENYTEMNPKQQLPIDLKDVLIIDN